MNRVLIVDDDEAILRAMSEALSDRGVTADLARAGSEARRLCENNRYDVIMLDMKLPIADEQSFADTLRLRDPRPVIIGLTLFRDEYLRRVDGHLIPTYVQKPFNPELLADIAQGCLLEYQRVAA